MLTSEFHTNIFNMIKIREFRTIIENLPEVKTFSFKVKNYPYKPTDQDLLGSITFINNKNSDRFKLVLKYKITIKEKRIIAQNFIFEIYSIDRYTSFRRELDRAELEELLEKRNWLRLILKIRLDQEKSWKKSHPTFHTQFGSVVGDDDQFLWFPSNLDIFRIPNIPLDIILVLEVILINFYDKTNELDKISEDQNWKEIRKNSENIIVQPIINNWSQYFTSNLRNSFSFLEHI
jgi:hypothetical protein